MAGKGRQKQERGERKQERVSESEGNGEEREWMATAIESVSEGRGEKEEGGEGTKQRK